jgi:hypothetical protein
MISNQIKKYIKYLYKILKNDHRFISSQEYKFKNKLKYLYKQTLLNIDDSDKKTGLENIDITNMCNIINKSQREKKYKKIINENKNNENENKYNEIMNSYINHLNDDSKFLKKIVDTNSITDDNINKISEILIELSTKKPKSS